MTEREYYGTLFQRTGRFPPINLKSWVIAYEVMMGNVLKLENKS